MHVARTDSKNCISRSNRPGFASGDIIFALIVKITLIADSIFRLGKVVYTNNGADGKTMDTAFEVVLSDKLYDNEAALNENNGLMEFKIRKIRPRIVLMSIFFPVL